MRWAAITVLLAVAILATPASASGDPWYSDMPGHWAEAAVRALWEEGVADGHQIRVVHWPNVYTTAWFFPDSFIARGEHSMMMAKVFALNPWQYGTSLYPDLYPGLILYGNKPAFAWVEAAARAGIMAGLPGGTFEPHHQLNRGGAVCSLVIALGLEDFALSLNPAQVTLYLSRFTDAWTIDPSIRHLIAAAVHLRILRGYPDRTLRLGFPLTRAEAATLIHRSCLFRLSSPVGPFYPDGDGHDEEAAVGVHSLRNRNAAAWKVEITNAQGLVLWTRQGVSNPPGIIIWDGRDSAGKLMPPGTYFAQGTLNDLVGNVYDAVPVPVYLEERTLSGYVSPSSATPGATAVITCTTAGRPHGVRVVNPAVLDLSPWSPETAYVNTWQASWTVSGAGPVNIEVVADFGVTTRTLNLTFNVLGGMSLEGWLEPDRVPAGARLTVHAVTTGDVHTVSARGAHGQVLLASSDGARWSADYTVPLDAVPGTYTMLVESESGQGHKQVELLYVVEESLRNTVEFILTD